MNAPIKQDGTAPLSLLKHQTRLGANHVTNTEKSRGEIIADLVLEIIFFHMEFQSD